MDFKDVIKQLSERVEKVKDSLQTEAATKNALIKPFIAALGYDVFDPFEVTPEFVCDIGTKKGEKIDYAILKDGVPIMLIECKHWGQDLNLHNNQLLRYFHASNAKFGVLTNGIVYRFYTDLEAPNKMDEKPFLEIDLLNIRKNQIEELKKFHKSNFDVDNILSSAEDLKYTSEFKSLLNSEFANPSPEFVNLFAKQVYSGRITAKKHEQFTELVKKSIAGLISETISERLKSALKTETTETKPTETVEPKTEQPTETNEEAQKLLEEKIDSFYIVRAILGLHMDRNRVVSRDVQSYLSILIDDSNRKLVCRLYLTPQNNKRIAFVGDDKKEIRHKIETIDEIYNYANQIVEAANKYKVI